MTQTASGRRFLLGYNTNGFSCHRLEDVAAILHELGYEALALTLDVHHLDPFAVTGAELARWRQRFAQHDLKLVIETGARFLLDPRRKHRPTLVSPTASERERRQEFLRAAIHCAAGLGATVVSIWSGALDDRPTPSQVRERLARSLEPLLDEARAQGVVLALEPEPGMAIESLADFAAFKSALGRDDLKLTIDIGHLQVTEEPPYEQILRREAHHLVNVHLDDARGRVHEHLFFGEGELPIGALLQELRATGFAGVASVELSRHAHDAVAVARSALEHLEAALDRPQ
jgi:sugar phosphate isomerase/epimerase